MIICVVGKSSLSRALHSIPDCTGRLISIRTSWGTAFCITRQASSALPQEATHLNPEEDSKSHSRLCRTPLSSSTMPTAIGDFRAPSALASSGKLAGVDCATWDELMAVIGDYAPVQVSLRD